MEEQLPAGLGEGEIAEFVEDDEVKPGKMIGNAALPAGTGLCLEPVDEVDDVEEAPACAVADEGTGNGDRQMRLAGAWRSSVILPGVRRMRFGSHIAFIHAREISSR